MFRSATTTALASLLLVSVASNTYGQGPQYSDDGKKLLLPKGFERWIFVGANVGLGYSEEAEGGTPRELERNAVKETDDAAPNPGDFHNIYLAPKSYRTYKETGKFPDGTILIMDVYKAKQKEPQNIVDRGFYESEHKDIEVAVKNSNRPDRTATSKGDWAYYIFSKDAQGKIARSAVAFDDNKCYDCHKKHADDDNVWVQFYPVIRKDK